MRILLILILLNTGCESPTSSGSHRPSPVNSVPKPPESATPDDPTKPPIPSKAPEPGIHFDSKNDGRNTVVRFQNGPNPITRQELISWLIKLDATGFTFRTILNKSIADLNPAGKNSVQIKMPVINATTANMPIYFVAVPENLGAFGELFADYFFNCAYRPINHPTAAYQARFWRLFALDDIKANFLQIHLGDGAQEEFGSAVFKGGYGIPNADEIMVSPCPKVGNLRSHQNQFLGHIYSFAQAVQDETILENSLRLHSFWYSVGMTAHEMFDGLTVKNLAGDVKQNLFLSTHGIGVPYLHFRVENSANHYGIAPRELQWNEPSADYLDAIFR